jgi:hypothetical protein
MLLPFGRVTVVGSFLFLLTTVYPNLPFFTDTFAPYPKKWLISWTSESLTAEHTENTELFLFLFLREFYDLRELCELCGET